MSLKLTTGFLMVGLLLAVVSTGCRRAGGCTDGSCASPYGPASSYGAPGQAFTSPPASVTQGSGTAPQPQPRPSFSAPSAGSGARPSSSFGGSGSR